MRDEMQEIFGALFDSVFAESVTAFTGEYMGPGVRDPITEETTAVPVIYSGRGVFHEYESERIDQLNILVGDIQLIVLANEVQERPKVGHLIKTISIVPILGVPMDGYRVVRPPSDPAGVHYDLQLRKA